MEMDRSKTEIDHQTNCPSQNLPERSANVNSLDFYAVGRLLGKGAFGKARAEPTEVKS